MGGRRREALWLAGALVVAALLRLHAIGRHGLWQDEIGSVLLAEDPGRVADPLVGHGPLYFRALGLWLRGGHAEAWVRCLSVVTGLLVVVAAYAAARFTLGPRAAGAVAWLTGISPVQIWVSREARPYVLMDLLALLAFLAWARGRDTGRWRWWVGFGVAAAAALEAHYYAVFPLAAMGLWTVVELCSRWAPSPRRLVLGFLLGTGIALALFAPQLRVALAGQRALGLYASQVKAFATRRTFPAKTAGVLLARSDPPHLLGGALEALASPRFTWVSALGLLALLWLGARQAVRQRSVRALAPWIALAGGPVLLAVATNAWRDVFLDARYLTLTSVFLAAPAAVWAEGFTARGRLVAAATALGLSLAALQPLYRRPASEIREATGYIDAHSSHGDCVGVVANKAFCYTYYSRAPRPVFDLPWGLPSLSRKVDSTLPLRERAVTARDIPAIATYFARCRDTWILYNEETMWGVDMGADILRRGLRDAGFHLLDRREFSDTRLERYEPPIEGVRSGTEGP